MATSKEEGRHSILEEQQKIAMLGGLRVSKGAEVGLRLDPEGKGDGGL